MPNKGAKTNALIDALGYLVNWLEFEMINRYF